MQNTVYLIREQLKAELRWRIQYVLNDCSTFKRIRSEHSDWFQQHQGTAHSDGLGAGNFMMAQSLCAALNVLAKVYGKLWQPNNFYDPAERPRIEAASEKLKTLSKSHWHGCFPDLPADVDIRKLLKGGRTKWKPPDGDGNEANIFTALVKGMKSDVNLGVEPGEAAAVWSIYRNKLAHMAAPPMAIHVNELAATSSFSKDANGDWVCNVDKLATDAILVTNWVFQKIDDCSDQLLLDSTLKWLQSSGSSCGPQHSNPVIILLMTFTEIVTALDESKKRIDALNQQLAEEQSKAKALFSEFQTAQAEMAALIGISVPAVTSKRAKGKRNMTPEGKLNIQIGAMLRKWKREHPQATDKQVKAHKEKIVAELKG